MTHSRPYRPQLIHSSSWKTIEGFYAELAMSGHQIEPLLELVKCIRETELQHRLYGFTSMTRLIISIYEELEWEREALHVAFNPATREWHFTYYAKPFRPAEYERVYAEALGIEKFRQVIRYLCW